VTGQRGEEAIGGPSRWVPRGYVGLPTGNGSVDSASEEVKRPDSEDAARPPELTSTVRLTAVQGPQGAHNYDERISSVS